MRLLRHYTRARAAVVDTHKVHDQLRDAIIEFQNKWRKPWRDLEFKRYKLIDGRLSKEQIDPDITNPRHFWAAQCANITPLGIPFDFNAPVPRFPVVVKPDYGAYCPLYFPPLEEAVADDGANIDLALPFTQRQAIRSLRSSLISRIGGALTVNPGDDWIAGQLVRFTYDQNDGKRTLAAAARCTSNSAFCAQLTGLAFEQLGDFRAADSVFRIADVLNDADLLEKNAKTKDAPCVSDEVLLLFSLVDNHRLVDAPCERQRTLVQQMWWLTDPLWATPGNERYVAHNSRSIHATLRAAAEYDERFFWNKYAGGEALRAMIIRYGWPSHTYTSRLMTKDPETKPVAAKGAVSQARIPREIVLPEYTPDRTHFMPAYEAIADPFILNDSHFDLLPPPIKEGKRKTPDLWWPVEHYKYPYLIAELPNGQDATWRRDSTIRYQLAVDDPLKNLDPAAKGYSASLLVGGKDAASTRALAQTEIGEGHTLRLAADLKSQPIVLSAEVLPRTTKEAAMRRRFGLRPPPTLREMKSNEYALSAPVFIRVPNRDMVVPSDEASVLRLMAGDLAFPATELLALYWESYGFIPGDTMSYELKFKRADDINAARRIGSFLGIVSALRDSVSIKWTEPDGRHTSTVLTGAKPTVGRSIAVDLKALPPGTYIVSIEMRKNATTFARNERKFVVKEP
ncbi:MAG: hypothetical protein ABJB74_11090 [Gemmatimonas sp.]